MLLEIEGCDSRVHWNQALTFVAFPILENFQNLNLQEKNIKDISFVEGLWELMRITNTQSIISISLVLVQNSFTIITI